MFLKNIFVFAIAATLLLDEERDEDNELREEELLDKDNELLDKDDELREDKLLDEELLDVDGAAVLKPH